MESREFVHDTVATFLPSHDRALISMELSFKKG